MSKKVDDFDARIQLQIDENGRFIISEKSIQAIAEAVANKIKQIERP